MTSGAVIRVAIDGIAPDGSGLARMNDRILTVRGALPGDVVDVRIVKSRHGVLVGRLECLVEPAVPRITPPCPHFDRCGGCLWQDVPPETQLAAKARIVRDRLGVVEGFDPPDDLVVHPSPDAFYYRNKMEFTFDHPPRNDQRFLGLHERGKFNRIFDVTDCRLQSPLSNRIVCAAREFAEGQGLTVYGLRSHVGLLRFLTVREGKLTGDLMADLVTSGEPFPLAAAFAEHLQTAVPELTTVVRTVNRTKSSVALGEEHDILSGAGVIREQVGDRTYVVSPGSFFQTNSRQTRHLYDTVREFCGLTGSERVLDLYCGAGTIGIYLAEGARLVTGVESVEDAVRDAGVNACANGIEHAVFISGQVEHLLDASFGGYDVVVCDPPRAGIHPRAMARLIELAIPRMVYVSCNIKALHGDMATLLGAGYRVEGVRVFDMAPHTPHIETVVLLVREPSS